MGFRAAIDVQALGDGLFGWDVPDGWQQGRGAWGGVVTGGLTRAVLLHEPDVGRTLRTVSVHMSGPLVVGPATVQVMPLRVGSGLSTWTATVTQPGGGLAAHAVVVTGRPRADDLQERSRSWGVLAPPRLPDWQLLPPTPAAGPGAPTFMQHLEFRSPGPLPLSGGAASCAGYVRFREPDRRDAAHLVSIVDAWFPTSFVVLDRLRPMATVAYSAHLLVDPADVPDDVPLAFESHLSAAHDGYTTETRRLWTPDGRLAVENHQSVAVIR